METKTMEPRTAKSQAEKDQKRAEARMLTGMFSDRDTLERSYNTLSERGYSKDDVNLVMSEDTRKRHFGKDAAKTELGNKATEGAQTGTVVGAGIGTVAGIIAAIGTSLVIPGLGLIVAGPILGALAGAGAGGITGGLIGALVGAGIPEDRAKLYEKGVKDGHIVMGVHPRNDEDAKFFENDWRTNRAKEVYR